MDDEKMSPHNALRTIEREIGRYPALNDRTSIKEALDVLWDYVIKGGNHGSGN